MLKTRKYLLCALLVGAIVALGSLLWYLPSSSSGSLNMRDAPEIHFPDALIRSHSLSQLPPELLRIPLARDVLTEDFVDYYEQNESRMALSGTLRRIAFEHKLDFPETLLKSVLDEPAEVALWRDDAGRLKDFVIALSRNTLARIIQTVLPIAAKASDMQLASAGTLDGTDVEILVLRYGVERHLLLLSKGDRIVALSNPGMLFANRDNEDEELSHFPQQEKAVEIIRELLNADEKSVSPFARHFFRTAPLPAKQHELTFGTRAFALNYDTFVPGLVALNLSFDDQGKWQTSALLDGAAWHDDGSKNLWTTLPHGPGLCAALPVNWAQMATLLKKFEEVYYESQPAPEGQPETLAASFAGPAAVCWYENSRLYMPLFAARLNADADEKKIQDFFNLAMQAINSDKYGISNVENAAALWQGEIASDFGSSKGGGQRSLKPALAIRGDLVFFSPDATLVKQALDVAAKRWPALSDNFPSEKDAPLLFIDPKALSSLLRNEIFIALPRNEEALFRNAAETYLVPRLNALARYPAQRVELSKKVEGEGLDWYPLEWKERAAR
ncbi:MAG: DUF2138 family protein [Zoogloeaceae bacterium]|jgi:uncharacterized protein YfaA (DUF2138 family)|nr:DUF2138 family protein [Zoogloeaceae bacterium]